MRNATARTSFRPRKSIRVVALTSPAFVLALVLLLLNDHVLKEAVGSWWTGKLSDVAGLFAFAVFWSALLPGYRRTVHVVIALAFVAWKSPLADAPLAAWNGLGVWLFARQVDYTDLVALAVLPVAYRWRVRASRNIHEWRVVAPRRIGAVIMAGVAIVAFSATSVRQLTPVPDSPSWTVEGTRAAVRMALDSLGFDPHIRGKRTERSADTIDVHVRHPPERWISVTLEVRDGLSDQASLSVVYVHAASDGPRPTNRQVFDAFAAQVVEPVRAWLRAR